MSASDALEAYGVPCQPENNLHVWWSHAQKAGEPCKCGARRWQAHANGFSNQDLARLAEIERRIARLERLARAAKTARTDIGIL